MKPNPDAAPLTPREPRLALTIATCFDLGRIGKAPGTLGALVGVVVIVLTTSEILALAFADAGIDDVRILGRSVLGVVLFSWIVFLALGVSGVWSATRVCTYESLKDPPHVIVDEVSGQHLSWLLGVGPWARGLGVAANWKYLLLGFILFRVFDIWKPFPVRQAEKLPGGWGIMADDWVAAVYAALGLWVARYLGL